MKTSSINSEGPQLQKIMLSPKIQSRSLPHDEPTKLLIPRQLSPQQEFEPCLLHSDDYSSDDECPCDSPSVHLESLQSIDSLSESSCEEIADEFEMPLRPLRNTLIIAQPQKQLKFEEKIHDLMMKFGFSNKEVIIEEEDPAMIQLTTQMSTHQCRTSSERVTITPNQKQLGESKSCKELKKVVNKKQKLRNSVVSRTYYSLTSPFTSTKQRRSITARPSPPQIQNTKSPKLQISNRVKSFVQSCSPRTTSTSVNRNGGKQTPRR